MRADKTSLPLSSPIRHRCNELILLCPSHPTGENYEKNRQCSMRSCAPPIPSPRKTTGIEPSFPIPAFVSVFGGQGRGAAAGTHCGHCFLMASWRCCSSCSASSCSTSAFRSFCSCRSCRSCLLRLLSRHRSQLLHPAGQNTCGHFNRHHSAEHF